MYKLKTALAILGKMMGESFFAEMFDNGDGVGNEVVVEGWEMM